VLAHLPPRGLPVLQQCLGTRAGTPYQWQLADLVSDLFAVGWPHRLASTAMTWFVCLFALWYVGSIVLVWALCAAAKRGDRPS
jgi:hypothetical protein